MNINIIIFALFFASCANAWEPSRDFIAYIKSVEGYRASPYYCAAGVKTIGYGHAIKQGEAYNHLSEQSATELLLKDIEAVKCRLNAKYGNGLSDWQYEVLTDYYFNLGSMRKFPKMEAAILNNDTQAMRREYIVYVNGNELGRNKLFYNRYLSDVR